MSQALQSRRPAWRNFRHAEARWAAAGVFALVVVAGLLCVAGSLLNDPDTQWHIAAGRLIWTTGRVPLTDPFSHTFAGSPWIAKEWLSQLMLYAAFSGDGWRGVTFLTAAAIGASVALLSGWLLARLRPAVVLMTVLLGCPLAAPEFAARPHVLVMPLIVAWMIGLVTALDKRTAPPLWLAGLVALWANMHASYPLALVLAGLLAAEGVCSAEPGERRKTLGQWGLFLAVSLAAACLSPYGVRTMTVAVGLLATPEATQSIAEWQPLALDPQGVATTLALGLTLAIMTRRWWDHLFRIALTLGLGYATVRHVRFAMILAVVLPVLVAGPLARCSAALRASGAPRVPVHPVAIATLIGLAGLIAATILQPAPSAAVTPTAALVFAQRQELTGPVYNDYDFGGFLILNGVKTFIDGRSDQLFAGGFTTRLNAAIDARSDADFGTLLDKRRVTWALVKPGSGEARHLSALPGWSRLFADGTAVVYARACLGREGCASGSPTAPNRVDNQGVFSLPDGSTHRP